MGNEHSIEHDLFDEWIKWLQENKPEHGFTYDGIVCRSEWINAPKHILFLLKDPNDSSNALPTLNLLDLNNKCDRDRLFNLRYYLQKCVSAPDRWRTWDNVARWAYGLMRTTKDFYPKFADADNMGNSANRVSQLKQVAVVDLKKKPGKSSCSRKDLDDYFAQYPESSNYIARQIALYGQLDYIICCGDSVYERFMDIIKENRNILSGLTGHETFYTSADLTECKYRITKTGTIIVDYRHPLILDKGVNKRNAYLRLMHIIQDALGKK